MIPRIADNEWGFSAADNNPFRIFRILQAIAKESVGEDQVIDLSRGDPGYGFTPGVRGRRFAGYILFLDTIFNHSARRVVEEFKSEHWDQFLKEAEEATRAEYQPQVAEIFLSDFHFFLNEVSKMAVAQGLSYTPAQVFYNLFKYCATSGGTYLDPQGEEVARVVVADWHQKFIQTPVDYQDLVFTNGASHAIGDLFKLLGMEGLAYLKPGDRVLITSPVYSPYNTILENRGLEVVSLSLDPVTGVASSEALKELAEYPEPVKAVVLVDPSNPTGCSMSQEILEAIGAFARKKNAVILTDEVYINFFPKKRTMIDICPERTIRIDARSKIERSTGLRFGDVLVTKEGQKFLMELFKPYMNSGKVPSVSTWKDLWVAAKGPGTIGGEFHHTTFVPGPAQLLGMAHIVLGAEERAAYKQAVAGNMEAFVQALELPHRGNMYYLIFDLNDVKGCRRQAVPIEEKLIQLAKRGIVYIPSNLFFSKRDRMAKDRMNTARASIVNTSLANVKKAAEITKEYLCG